VKLKNNNNKSNNNSSNSNRASGRSRKRREGSKQSKGRGLPGVGGVIITRVKEGGGDTAQRVKLHYRTRPA
jgi:hypothetical protein